MGSNFTGAVGADDARVVLVEKKLPRNEVSKGELIPLLFERFRTDVRHSWRLPRTRRALIAG
jgi:hypothetical protein